MGATTAAAAEWRAIWAHNDPHLQPLPKAFTGDLNKDGVDFERLCLLRCLVATSTAAAHGVLQADESAP